LVARNRRRYPNEFRTPRASYFRWKKDEIEKVLDSLRKRSLASTPIIVEGQRDKEALDGLGISGKILCLKSSGQSRSHFLDGLDGLRDIILLTDFDAEGVELRAWLYQELTRRGVRADDLSWRRIRSLARAEVKGIQDLPSFIRSVEVKSLGKRPDRPRPANLAVTRKA
jgi:5S rRNA maturation endonuclease (ribonuclease M5)